MEAEENLGVRGVRRELVPMLRLALPVILAELGWMAMALVDTIMVGSLGPAAIGAVGVGGILFESVAIGGMGLLLGLDTVVSQAYGARRLDECHRWLVHGVHLSLILILPLMAIVAVGGANLHRLGFHPEILTRLVPYFWIVSASLLPLLIYSAFRRYLQAMDLVAPVTFALVSANILNAAGNWALIYGKGGFPAMGTDGAAWATVASRVYMAVVLVVAAFYFPGIPGPKVPGDDDDARRREGLRHVAWRLETARLKRLVRLGAPASGQIVIEVGVFAAAGALAARLNPIAVAAHQIVLMNAGTTFMIPLGISSAAAVRVGQAIGRCDPAGARRSGWTAVLLGVSFMGCAAAVFLLAPTVLLSLFTRDAAVIQIGTSLLFVAAIFQLFDGVQVVTTGALRGLGDTRTPMLTNLAGHWCLGLPIGYALSFPFGWGVIGLWVGLSSGLIAVAIVLLMFWWHRSVVL
jgi:MATE family multidrug resistance protein